MDTEKDFLKRDLEKAESEEEIKQLVEDAEMLGHEDVVKLAKAKLEAISAKAKSAETTPPAQIAQVESMDGSSDEVEKRTEGVDAEIKAVKAEAEEKIVEVQGEKIEVTDSDSVSNKQGVENPKTNQAEATAESSVEKLKAEYNKTLEKIQVAQKELKVLEDEEKKLKGEKEEAEKNGGAKKIVEIEAKINENNQNQKKSQQELSSLENERKELVLKFKKQYGYDETVQKEAYTKLFQGSVRTDANRIVLNNYLGLSLPIISKDLRLKPAKKEGQFNVIDDNSPDGIYNNSLLVQKRAELILRVKKASTELKDVPKEVVRKLLEESQLEWEAINVAGSEVGENENISDVFTTFVRTGQRDSGLDDNHSMYGDDKITQEAKEKMKSAGFESSTQMSLYGAHDSTKITRTLLIYKIAKEKGLIK